MKTIITLLAVFSIALFYTSCNEEGSIINTPENQVGSTEYALIGEGTGWVDNPPSGPFRHLELTSGTSTIFGECTGSMDYMVTSYNSTTGGGTWGFGKAVLIDKNGQKLYTINVQGTFQFSSSGWMTSTGTGIISGGTGKFKGAYGTITYSGTMDPTRNYTGEWTGTFENVKEFSGAFVGETINVTNTCTSPFVKRHTEGSGTMLHFGNTSAVTDHCINMSNGMIVNGNGTITAPNGDIMNSTYIGFTVPTAEPNVYKATLYCNITGGTGRFDGATGAFTLVGLQEMPNGSINCTVQGAIDY